MSKEKGTIEELEQFDFVDDEDFEKLIAGYPTLIGEFIVSFSALEHYLNGYIADYLADDFHDRGYRIVEKLSFANKVDYLCKAYTGREIMVFGKSKGTSTIDSIRKELTAINKFRNNIAHANWLTIDKEGQVRTKLFVDGEDGLVKFAKTKIAKDDIKKIIKKTDTLPDIIYDYEEDYNNRANKKEK